MRALLNIVHILLALLSNAGGLDLTWIPADADGPLPVSENYRDALTKLCTIIKGKEQLAPELIGKKEIIERMCVKLSMSKNASVGPSNPSVGYAVAALLGFGTLYLLWGYSKHLIFISSRSPVNPTPESLREIRVKKFL